MTATGALIARHVTDLFPTQTSRFDLAQAARRANAEPAAPVEVRGYTDSSGSPQADVALSRARAQVVADALVARGFRTLVPYVRGFGPTRFLAAGTMRSGEIGAIARDIIAFADALRLPPCPFVGHDWGARAGYATVTLEPARFTALVAVAVAYATNFPGQELSLDQVRAYWYQWFFGTPRGESTFTRDPASVIRYLWHLWSPGWTFDEATLAATAASFRNPDIGPSTIHSYGQRWGGEPSDERYRADRERLESLPKVHVPTTTILGADDGATLPASAEGRERYFEGPYRCRIVPGAGHFVPRERPDVVAEEILALANPPAAAKTTS